MKIIHSVSVLYLLLAVGGRPAAAQPKPRETWAGHSATVGVGVFSPDGKSLVTRSRDDTARLWDVASGKGEVIARGFPGETFFGTDGKHLILKSMVGGEFTVYDMTARKLLQWPTTHEKPLAFSADGKSMLRMNRLAEVELVALDKPFDRATAGKPMHLQGVEHHDVGKDTAYAFSPDGKTLVTRDKNRNLVLWDVATGKSKTVVRSAGLWFTFNPRGDAILAESGVKSNSIVGNIVAEGGIALFSVATTKSTASLQLDPSDAPFTQFVFSSDGRQAFSASAWKVSVWNTATGKLAGTFEKPGQVVYRVALSPDGRTLAGMCHDGTAHLWYVATKKIIAKVPATSPLLAFSPKGDTLAVADSRGTLYLYDLPIRGAGK